MTKPRFDVGDTVWYVQSGTNQRYVTCPDCLGQRVLTVILGDDSQVSVSCTCCERGYLGSQGQVLAYDWHCEVLNGPIVGMDVDHESVKYKVQVWHVEGSYTIHPDAVYASEEDAREAAVKVLADHKADEAHRFANVKDQKGRHRSWAWNATYHRNCARRAEKELEYHRGRLAVAKTKAKLPEVAP